MKIEISVIQNRSKMSLKDCCLAEVSKDCERMCSARNLEDALSSALENCKLEMYKLQWCYMTQRSEHIKIETAEESVLAASVDEKRIECCSKDSVPSECLGIFFNPGASGCCSFATRPFEQS